MSEIIWKPLVHVRELFIERGVIVPGERPSPSSGDPTPFVPNPAPTLMLDHAAVRAMRRDAERSLERRQPRDER